MECINEFMYLEVASTPHIDQSYGASKHDDTTVFLTFGLFANDCLFDLADTNYTVQLRISKAYFSKYNETLPAREAKTPICCTTQSKLLELIRCKLTGIHRKIVLESTVLFLIHKMLPAQPALQLDCEGCAVLNNPLEAEKIQRAKKYILDNLSNTLTIPIIASSVGTNQCYLKKGFKEVFDQTIYKFIQENRMVKAQHLLQYTNATITEVAFAVGYASLSSFSQAYKHYFGVAPTEVGAHP